jgi:hypothetical protein
MLFIFQEFNLVGTQKAVVIVFSARLRRAENKIAPCY